MCWRACGWENGSSHSDRDCQDYEELQRQELGEYAVIVTTAFIRKKNPTNRIYHLKMTANIQYVKA